MPLAEGCDAVCAFVNDDLGEATLRRLAAIGVRHVALRSAGFNHVDLHAARELGISVVRVPAYSPNAVAEHTIALILGVNRHIARAHYRVRDHNFSLDGLVGFDLKDKTVGVVGTGNIGALVARLLWHFRCRVLAFDPVVDETPRRARGHVRGARGDVAAVRHHLAQRPAARHDVPSRQR